MATNAIFKIYGSENWSKKNLVHRFSFSLETNENGNNKKEQRNVRLPGAITPNWLHRKFAHNINTKIMCYAAKWEILKEQVGR